jgi:hypothetical protein
MMILLKNYLVVDWNDFILNINKDTISDTKVYEFNTSFKVNTSLEWKIEISR